MELKWAYISSAESRPIGSNRTFMELKLNKTLKTILQVISF